MSTTPPPISFVHSPGRLSPTEVAEGSYLVHQIVDFPPLPLSSHTNSLVIQAEQPVIVDTGSRYNRDEWLKDVFSLVDASEVGWVFVSHPDPDHAGNLEAVLRSCPKARLVCGPLFAEYVSFDLPADTLIWPPPSPGNPAKFDAGDREMLLVPPPRYDNPLTMGLLDSKTGAYWAADAFGCFVAGGAESDDLPRDVSELDDQEWKLAASVRAKRESPWLTIIDDDRFAAEAERFLELGISTVLSAHSPAITGDNVAKVLSELPKLPAQCRQAPSLEAYIGQIWSSTQTATAGG
jgi:hypothetical protein